MSPEDVSGRFPVQQVVLFEDRAQIAREGWVGPSERRLHISGVSVALVPGSLSAWFVGGGGRVLSIRAEHCWERPESVTKAQAELEAARAQVQDLRLAVADERGEVDGSEREFIDLTRLFSEEALVGNVGEVAEALERALRELELAEHRLAACFEERQRVETDLEGLRSLFGRGTWHPRAHLELQVEAPPEGGILRIQYLSGNALWRPSYAARLQEEQITFEFQATAWQRTGEVWKGIELSLSTARSATRPEAPPLHEDRLQFETRGVLETVRTEAAWAQGAPGEDDRGQTEPLPGVDDGGETRSFRVPGQVSLRGDGRGQRLLVGDFQAPATTSFRCVPELSARVELVAQFRNQLKLDKSNPSLSNPLLAGPVTLFRDGARVGLGEVGFVGPGEPCELSFGAIDEFVVDFNRTKRVEERALRSNQTWFVSTCRIHHTGGPIGQPRGRGATDSQGMNSVTRIELLQRVPVSELDGVEVIVAPGRPGRQGPDHDGKVRDELSLSPGETAKVELSFRLEKGMLVSLADPW